MSARKNTPAKILAASMIGTTIEFFDFYIYATAAVLVFPTLFFPSQNPEAAILQSLATFALAFLARPIGAIIFGHFGDRYGRKSTLVAALLTMGLSTVLIGLLPTYAQIGLAAPLLLALCRFGQGVGLGGEWGGAVLLATENAPKHRQALYGMFPQLGAPLGFVLSTGIFMLLSQWLTPDQFMQYGWRIPFIGSMVLVLFGLYVRLTVHETRDFREQSAADGMPATTSAPSPLKETVRQWWPSLMVGTFASISTFVLFYLMTVFALSWGTTQLGYGRPEFLKLELLAVSGFALAIPVSAWLADQKGVVKILAASNILMIGFSLLFTHLFAGSQPWQTLLFLWTGLFVMGLSYGPLGTFLGSLFPTRVRYTGTSIAFNMAGILGASFAPYIATWLAGKYGIGSVGGYLSALAVASLVALYGYTRLRAPAPDASVITRAG